MKRTLIIAPIFYVLIFSASTNAAPAGNPYLRTNYIEVEDLEFKFYSQTMISATGTLGVPAVVVAQPFNEAGVSEAMAQTKKSLEERFTAFRETLNASILKHWPAQDGEMAKLLESLFGYAGAVANDMRDFLPRNKVSMSFMVLPGKREISQLENPLLNERSALKEINFALRSMRQALVKIPIKDLPPASPLALLIRIDLAQGASQIVVQSIAALNPLLKSVQQSTESAEFSHFVIPSAKNDLEAPVVLSTMTLPLFKPSAWPTLTFQFGHSGRLEESAEVSGDFSLSVQSDGMFCSDVSSFPFLFGHETYTGYIPIKAYIKSADIDLKELEIRLLEVRAGLPTIGCFNQDVLHKSLVPNYGADQPKLSEIWLEVKTWIGMSLTELHDLVKKEREPVVGMP